MENKNDMSAERTFLHDLASPLSILKLLSMRLLKMSSERESNDAEKRILEQMLKAVDSLEKLHADHKAYIFEKRAS